MTSVPSTFSSHSNFASVFIAALETYKQKTKKDLASLLPRLQSCNSSEAILAVLREQFPTSMRADHQCRRVPCHLATVLTYCSTDAGGGLDKSARLGDAGYDPVVELDGLEKILGLSWHDREYRDREARRGVVWGLVVTGMGKGELMPVESYQRDRGARTQLGQDVRVHLPASAQKKDGPSAGVVMVYTIVFLLTGKYVPPTTAAACEITLRGRVSPVGGMKEKVLGAHRAGWQEGDPTVGESERR
ncbi:Lon protease C-terminal proteolytic domain-containing protein [Russula aff. rugulosa BPL654]|nr:Lon protease C-terminal proteolytic domain-containing protein [Russula aff. rugulosa BPL654]